MSEDNQPYLTDDGKFWIVLPQTGLALSGLLPNFEHRINIDWPPTDGATLLTVVRALSDKVTDLIHIDDGIMTEELIYLSNARLHSTLDELFQNEIPPTETAIRMLTNTYHLLATFHEILETQERGISRHDAIRKLYHTLKKQVNEIQELILAMPHPH